MTEQIYLASDEILDRLFFALFSPENEFIQILNAGKRLWSKTAAHGTDAQQVKAALFLGQKGLEIADVPDRLKNLATTRNLEPLNPVVHTDIEGFLRNEHENAILSGTVSTWRRQPVYSGLKSPLK